MDIENIQNWPEKMAINRLVTRQDAIDKILSGKKTSERRNDRYADKGDTITLDGQIFVVHNVYPQKLKSVTEENAKQEGYSGLEDYKKALTSIHQGAVWDPEAVVWVHEFKKNEV